MSSNLADRERMNQLIEQIDPEIEYDATPLCKRHYYTIYNLIRPHKILPNVWSESKACHI